MTFGNKSSKASQINPIIPSPFLNENALVMIFPKQFAQCKTKNKYSTGRAFSKRLVQPPSNSFAAPQKKRIKLFAANFDSKKRENFSSEN